MDSILPYIVDLKKQVDLLATSHKEMKVENQILSSERGDLLNKIDALEVEIKDLKKRVEIVDIAQGISVKNVDSIDVARNRVSGLIRQIDKCIALLNE
tara:strand:+ start:143 stop:436 length:294 start_codon:yes stop_codon:yes gene_type:complete